jgi:hypothetical protein
MAKISLAQKLLKLSQSANMDPNSPPWVSHALYSMHKELIGDNVGTYTQVLVEKIKNASDHIRNGASLK